MSDSIHSAGQFFPSSEECFVGRGLRFLLVLQLLGLLLQLFHPSGCRFHLRIQGLNAFLPAVGIGLCLNLFLQNLLLLLGKLVDLSIDSPEVCR